MLGKGKENVMSNSKRVVNRWFCAILYEEDPNFQYFFDYIRDNYEQVTYIKHDKDINEDGTTKKSHIHILFKVGDNARHLTRVAEEIGIQPNYLQGCNKKAMLLYLIHYRNEDKTKYNIEDVQGELKGELQKLVNRESKTEEERYKDIYNAILNKEIVNTTQLLKYAIENNMLEEIRKSQYLLCKVMEEQKKYRLDKIMHKM